MKFDLSVLYHQANSFSILPAEDNRNAIYIVTNNQRIGNEVYNEIIASYDREFVTLVVKISDIFLINCCTVYYFLLPLYVNVRI